MEQPLFRMGAFIPSAAFKNANSSYRANRSSSCGGSGGLYEAMMPISAAPAGFRQASDPGTFFVKTVKITSATRPNQTTFYEPAARDQRYSIYNPYAGRGAIEGLLPHGRITSDVSATHI